MKIPDGENVVLALVDDERMRNIAIGLGADGVFPGVMNITSAMDTTEAVGEEWLDADNENSFTRVYSERPGIMSDVVVAVLNSLEDDIRSAKESGWHVRQATSEQRADWERKYYGRTFGGDYRQAGLWALVELERFYSKVTGKPSDMLGEYLKQLDGYD